MDFTIVATQGTQLLTEVFNAIAAVFGTSSYQTLLRIAALMGFVIVLLTSVFRQKFMDNIHWLVSIFILYNLLLVPKVTVHIEDRVSQQHAVVDNVPLGLALLASVTSQIGDAFTQLMEQTFSLPNDLRYSQSGTVMASRLVENATQWKPVNPEWLAELKAFVQGCVWYDVLLNKYSLEELMSTSNLWGLVSSQASVARLYPSKEGLMTCLAGSQQLTQAWPGALEEASAYYGGRIFTQAERQAKAAFLSYLPTSVNYLTGFSQSGSEALQQILMANVFYDTVTNPQHSSSRSAGMPSLALAHMKLLQYANGWTLGAWGAQSLVLLKNVLEALLYGGFVIIAWVLLLPQGLAVIKNYAVTLLWLQSFAPLYAVLNLVMTFHAQSLSHSAFQQASFAPLSLEGLPMFASTNADMVTVASWLSFSIPAIAYGLVRGGIAAVSQGIGQLSYLVQSLTMRTAEEATSGNVSFGNTQLDTHSAHMNTAYQTNRNITLQSGMVSYQQPDGAMIHRTAEGSSVIDSKNAISTTAADIKWSQAIRQVSSEQKEHALTAGMQHSQQYSVATTAALRELVEAGNTQGFSNSQDNQYNLNQATNWHENTTQAHQLVTRFARDHQLSESQAVTLLGEASAAVGLSASLSSAGLSALSLPASFAAGVNGQVRAGAQIQGLSSAQQSELFHQAKDYVQSTQLHETLDLSLRAAHDQHQRQGTEQSSRLTQQLSYHYENATAAKHEASAQFQKADSFRQMENLSQEDAMALFANLNQPFVNWLEAQPQAESHIPLGITGAEALLNQHSEKITPYVEKFIQQQLPAIHEKMTTSISDANAIKTLHQANEERLGDPMAATEKVRDHYQSQWQREATTIKDNHPTLASIQSTVEQIHDEARLDILQAQGEQKEQEALMQVQQQNVFDASHNQHALTQKAVKNAEHAIESLWNKE